MHMTIDLMKRLVDMSSYVFEEMTSEKTENDLAKDFWKYLRSRLLDDMTKKVRISEFVRDYVLGLDEADFFSKYGRKISNVKKSKAQMSFVCSCISLMLQHSAYGVKIMDWS